MAGSPYDHIADVYDVFVQTDADIPFFLTEAGKTSGEILELMAGTGRVTLPLARAGARLTAVDNSAEMLSLLRDKLASEELKADVQQMDVRGLRFSRRFDLILIPFHAFAELTCEDDQRQTLNGIYAHLEEGGRFICALHNPPVRLRSADGQLKLIGSYPHPEGKLLVWLRQAYDPRRKLVDIAEFFEFYSPTGEMTSRRLLEMSASFVEKVQFERLILDAGFKVLALYGDYQYAYFDEATSPFMIWVLGR
jgi:SAM-dependent methyltransferase